MANYFAGASRLAYVSSWSASGWDGSGAMQGRYGSGSPRVGAMFFPALGNVNWAEQSVSGIRLGLDFAGVGAAWEKTLGLYEGTKYGAPSGTGGQMLGAAIGSVPTGGAAYANSRIIAFSGTENAAVFARLKEWLKKGVYTLALFVDEETEADEDYSANYLKITGASVSVDYEPLGSGGRLSTEQVDAGGTVTLTIEPADQAGVVSHRVLWTLGDASSDTAELEPGALTAAFTVPMDWLYQIPDAERGTAGCVLTTLVDGEVKSGRTIPFTVTVPADVLPVFDAQIAPEGTSGGYYQKLGGARIAIADAASAYGASVTGYRIAGSEGLDEAAESVVTPVFAGSGAHAYTLSVTDSRGRTAEKTLQIDVNAVEDPWIEEFEAERCEPVVNDAGETVYEASPAGAYVWVTIRAGIDTAGGNNAPSAAIRYGDDVAALPWTEGAVFEAKNDLTIITAQISLNAAQEFTLTVSDNQASATARAHVEKGGATMVVEPHGVAFGGFSTATEEEPKDEFHRKTVFYGEADGVVRYASGAAVPTGKRWIDGKRIYASAAALGACAAGVEARIDAGVPAETVGEVVGVRGVAYTDGWTHPLPYVRMAEAALHIQFEVGRNADGLFFSVIPGSGVQMTGGYGIVEFTMDAEYENVLLRALHDEDGARLTDENEAILTV